ncbi:MAG TPA: RluA family pseudouridine synthase, partial [Patescibacteria group bacterium]
FLVFFFFSNRQELVLPIKRGLSMLQIEILYEDEDLLVINKPAGVTVNRAETTKNEITIQDWAAEKIGIKGQELTETENSFSSKDFDPKLDFYKRGGVVHRLDKETSGVLILAKNPEAFVELQRQFREREVKKVYIALAHGKLTPEEGEINVPVGRLPWNKKQFGILPGGRESKTVYKVLAYYKNPKDKESLSLVELYPYSGRTHQIRVHLKYIGHPIFADFLYAGRKTARKDRIVLERVFLHAAKITFLQPSTKTELTLESPLAPELKELLKKMYNENA